MPQLCVGARGSHVVWPWVGLAATMPHPYKPLGFFQNPNPIVHNPSLSFPGVGEKTHFRVAIGVENPSGFKQHNFLV